MNLHGPMRWFQGHTFVPLAQAKPVVATEEAAASFTSASLSFLPLVLYGIMSFCATVLLVLLLYRFILKPRLIRKHLKQD